MTLISMKATLITAGVGLLVVFGALAGMDVQEGLGAKKPDPTPLGVYTEQQVIDWLTQYENGERTLKGKYTQILENGVAADGTVQIPDNIKRNLPPLEVHVYYGPLGKGYQVIFTRTRTVTATTTAGDYTVPQTRSVGFGPEATARTWDWRDWY